MQITDFLFYHMITERFKSVKYRIYAINRLISVQDC